jgi:hypothetical protein
LRLARRTPVFGDGQRVGLTALGPPQCRLAVQRSALRRGQAADDGVADEVVMAGQAVALGAQQACGHGALAGLFPCCVRALRVAHCCGHLA